MRAFGGITRRTDLCWCTCDAIVFTVKVKLQLIATNEMVAADAAADNINNSNSSSADIFEVTSYTLIDSDSPAEILK